MEGEGALFLILQNLEMRYDPIYLRAPKPGG